MSEASPSIEAQGSPAAIAAPTQGAAPAGWPWSRLARPAVIAGEPGAIDATAVAAIDHAVTAACDALAAILARPVRVELSNDAGSADAAPQGFGLALSCEGGIAALIMLDTRAARLFANAMAIDQGGAAGSTAPGPVGELSDVEKGLIEFLTLDVLDRALKPSHGQTRGPVIQSFCDGAAAGVWLQRHQSDAPRTIALGLAMTGSTGLIRVHIAGLSEVHAAALVGCLSMLDMTAGLGNVNLMLALPAVALQPEEFAAMQPGDVLLLGGPSLTAMPLAGELVTDTHWSLGRAVVTHDTPTYLTVSVTPVQPGPRAAALVNGPVVQAMVGLGNETIEKLRSLREGDVLNLAKEPVTPVGLYHGPKKIAAGELVVLGSELGVRIVEMK